MEIEPISLVLIIITMVSTILHLILDMLKYRSTEKIDRTKLKLEQGKAGIDKTKLELEQQKAGMNYLMELFPIKEYADLMLKDPEAFKQKFDELKETAKKLKKLMNGEGQD